MSAFDSEAKALLAGIIRVADCLAFSVCSRPAARTAAVNTDSCELAAAADSACRVAIDRTLPLPRGGSIAQSAPTWADVGGCGDAEPAVGVLMPGTGGVPIGVADGPGEVPQAAAAAAISAAATPRAPRETFVLLPEALRLINTTFPMSAALTELGAANYETAGWFI